MADSFQNEIPKARINITLELETGGVRKKKELPLKMLVLGDFSHGKARGPVGLRERITVNKTNLDQIIANINPEISFSIPSLKREEEQTISLKFSSMKDFHPENIVLQIPALKKLLAMRNLLKELKANLIDNQAFRRELEKTVRSENDLMALKQELQLTNAGTQHDRQS